MELYGFLRVFALVFFTIHVRGQWQTLNPAKSEGESCGSLNGLEWTCQRDLNCSVTPYLIRKGWVITCSGQGSERVICCPRLDKISTLSDRSFRNISAQKCQLYQAQVCSFRSGFDFRNHTFKKHHRASAAVRPNQGAGGGVDKSKLEPEDENYEDIFETDVEESTDITQVFNGEKADPGEFPYAALVGFEPGKRWLCGGTLVSDRFVLSAAHCAAPDGLGPAKWVRLGDLDYATDSDEASPQDFFIVQSFIHPDYNKDLIYNDIVLFRLDHPAVFNQFVSPVCLHPDLADPAGTVTAAGWGKTGRQKGVSSQLIKVELNLIASEECKKRIKESDLPYEQVLPSGVDGRTMVCAWEQDKDACEGDSGGPLVLTSSSHCLGQLVGITSFGPGSCDSSDDPGIYTRVPAFLPWLESIVWPTPGT